MRRRSRWMPTAGERIAAGASLIALLVAGARAGAGLVDAGETPPHDDARAVRSTTLNVSAAASLSAAFTALAGAFERKDPAVRVVLDVAGSPTLVEQIRHGAPADVFAAADETTMRQLVDAGEIAGVPAVFARNLLAIAVATGNPERITTLADLTRPGLAIALCARTVPCGRYAAAAFAKAGVAVPLASEELDVKAVVTKVAMGEADAGVVYVTDVRAAAGKVEGVNIPEAADVVARYPIALLKSARSAAAGAAFVAFVLAPEGQAILAGLGFLPLN